MMTNGDSEGRNFLFHPYKDNGFFFLLIIDCLIKKNFPGHAEMHYYIILTSFALNIGVT